MNMRRIVNMNQLSIIERAVAELLPIGGERKINITDITKLVDLDRREVYAVIQSLRSKGRRADCSDSWQRRRHLCGYQ